MVAPLPVYLDGSVGYGYAFAETYARMAGHDCVRRRLRPSRVWIRISVDPLPDGAHGVLL